MATALAPQWHVTMADLKGKGMQVNELSPAEGLRRSKRATGRSKRPRVPRPGKFGTAGDVHAALG